MVHPYSGILLRHKKQVLIWAIMWMNLEYIIYCNIMLRKKPDTKDCILYDYIYMKYPEIGKSIGTESRLEIA